MSRKIPKTVWVRAAHEYLLSGNWDATAKKIGVRVETLARWRSTPEWESVVRRAEKLWHEGVARSAKNTIKDAIEDGDTKAAMWYLERLDNVFRPPTKRAEITGRDGGPVMAVTAAMTQEEATEIYMEIIRGDS